MKRLSFSSLRIQLISLILLAMVPIAALMLYTDMVERRAAVTHVRKDVMRIADLAIIDEAQLVKDIRQFLITLSHFPQIQSGKPAECNALLKDLLGHRQRYANLGVIKPNGTLYCSALPFSGSINLVDRAYFQRAVKMNDFSIGEYQVGRVTGKCTINFAYPLLDDSGMIKRIVYAALDLSWLNYKFEYQIEKELPKGSTLTKIDSNGVVLVRYPDPEEWIGRKIERQPDLEKQILENKKGLLEARGQDGVLRLYAFMPMFGDIDKGNAYLVLGIPKKAVFANIDRSLTTNAVFLGIVFFLTFAAAWFASERFILRKVKTIIETTRRLAQLPHFSDQNLFKSMGYDIV